MPYQRRQSKRKPRTRAAYQARKTTARPKATTVVYTSGANYKRRQSTRQSRNPNRNITAITKRTMNTNYTVCNPSRSLFPLTVVKTLFYQFRSSIQSLAPLGVWQERLNINSMYDPDGSPNNLGNKQPMGFDTICNSSGPYTAYKVLKTVICYRVRLLSAPGAYNVDEAYYKNASGTPAYSTHPGPVVTSWKPTLPLSVWVMPPYMSDQEPQFDEAAELVKAPGVKRIDLYRQFQQAIVKKAYWIKPNVRRLGGKIDNDGLRAAAGSNPNQVLELPILITNPNSDTYATMSFVVDLEMGFLTQFSGLNSNYITE